VSWVTGTDIVHFDKASTVANNKVKIAFTTDVCGAGKTFSVVPYGEMFGILEGVSVNGVPYEGSDCSFTIDLEANTNYLIEYELKSDVTDVSSWFNIDATEGCSSNDHYKYDILFPAQVTNISSISEEYSINSISFEGATPPTLHLTTSSFTANLYVPDANYNDYASAYWPYVNPYRLPGTTITNAQREQKTLSGRNAYAKYDFVGGCYNDINMVVAMKFASELPAHNFKSSLIGNKAYFIFGDILYKRKLICVNN
jgi:hypothetical protein